MWNPESPGDGHVEVLRRVFFFNLHLKISSWKIGKAIKKKKSRNYLFISFLCLVFRYGYFSKHKIYFIWAWGHIMLVAHILCVCVCVCEEGRLHSIYCMIGSMFHLYESQLHYWLYAVIVGHGHVLLTPCLTLSKSYIKYCLYAGERPWIFLSHLNSP